ncbi:hypothetical protein [Bradyrhizobium sp. SYSU BS000235]|uniref:hypothetical protein n=1 Tax=Bradyrhizobium sp. SYSU BS000235 TaxID=3411332 RepID=UPI003C795DB8
MADDAPQSVHELASIAEQKLRPMREATLDNPPVITDTLQQAFDSPVARKGFAEGVRLEQLRNGQAFDPRRYGIAGFTDRGEPVVSGPPNIRALDLVKQGLDSLLEKNPKASTTEGRLYANARQNFLKELGATHSDYTRVREGYDGYGSLVDAEAMGREAAATPGRSESNARRFSDLNDFEQHAHRLGFARGAAEDLGSSMMENKAPGLTLRGDIRAQSLHQGPVKPGRLDPLQRYFERENAMYKTHAALDGMPAEKPEGVAKELGAAAVNAASGKLSSAGSSLVNTIKLLTSDNDTVRRRIAERLLLNGEAMDPASVLGLNDAVRRIETNRQLGNLARGGILGAVAVAPYATGVR